MVMDSIKFRSVHLMDDGDGHHNFGIDGDGDGHHFKGDGCHVWWLWCFNTKWLPIYLFDNYLFYLIKSRHTRLVFFRIILGITICIILGILAAKAKQELRNQINVNVSLCISNDWALMCFHQSHPPWKNML